MGPGVDRVSRPVGPVDAVAPHRVLFVTHTSEWIGPNISLLELVTRLPDQLSGLVAVPGTGRFTEALEVRDVPVRLLRRVDKYGIPALIRMIRSERIALVYGNSTHGASRNALVAAKFCNVPFVYHLREMGGHGWRHSRRLFPWADAAVAVSKATAESYQGSFRESPRVIYNGVSLEGFGLDRESSRREVATEFGIDEASPLIIHVGNVYERKGQLMAVEVTRGLQDLVPGCCLLIVGRLDRDPAYVDSVRASIAEYDLEDRVIMTGLRTDVGRLLAAADVFLHTALEDPHPRAVIEAMAARLPVVALAVDGVSETVVDGETGFLVRWPGADRALADPLARLLKNPELRRELGERGRDRAGRLFSADRTARDVVAVIRGLVGFPQ
jgi:glycosyltransferase involved in cell wall biosynthesis